MSDFGASMLARINVERLSVADHEIGVRRAGSAGPCLFFLHGSHRSGAIFERNLGLAGNWARAIAPDRPGYGLSSRVRPTEPLPDMVEVCKSVIDHLQLDDLILFGESRGGGLAIEIAARYPLSIRGLVLSSPVALPPNELPKPAETEAVRSWAWFVERSVDDPSAFTEAERDSVLADLDKAQNYEERRARDVTPEYNRYGLVEQLASLDTPTVLIWGRQDPVFPVESSIRFRELLADLRRTVIVERARHLAFFEYPALVDQQLREFATELGLLR